ncbi:MAG TPA: hypothetical protein VNL91_01095 [Thermoanaerobaculia bacterium]|nr:hypothetical protein [Thermoanaerobaculia bacterium]
MPGTVFLLSPASLGGTRAKQLTSPRASFDVALRYRSPEGVEIADAFAFMSALYFRGKIAYARHFGEQTFIIAPGFGLVPPEWRLTGERMKIMRRTPVDVTKRSYVRPLREHAEALAEGLDDGRRVVLLGSVASGKYIDVLHPVLGDRLLFPSAFAGLGDMSRGGLMLRAVRHDRELEYATLDAPRRSKDAVGRARRMFA